MNNGQNINLHDLLLNTQTFSFKDAAKKDKDLEITSTSSRCGNCGGRCGVHISDSNEQD